jgi:GT2 family glycosyltransferase
MPPVTDPAKAAFPLLSTITVTYNSAPFIGQALESVRVAAQRAGLEVQSIVIDNASSDDSADLVASQFPMAHLVRNLENVGFGAANNQAFGLAIGDIWLLVNPDSVLEPDCIGRLALFLAAHPRAAMVGPRIMGRLGSGPESAGMSPGVRSMAGHFLLLNRLLPGRGGGAWQGWQLASRPQLGARRVDWVGGTVAALRPDAIRAVGGFDSAFFLYFEDVDLGERLRRAGWQLWLEPDAVATHQISHGRISTAWLDAMHSYIGRSGSRARLILVTLIVAVGLTARAAARSAAAETPRQNHEALRARANARHALRLLGTALVGKASSA